MLAGDEPALAVAGVAVGEVRRLAEDADLAGLLLPLEDAVVRDVAPQQIAAVAEPHRPLGPAAAGIEALDRGAEDAVAVEARIEALDQGVGIAGLVAPAAARGVLGGHRWVASPGVVGGGKLQRRPPQGNPARRRGRPQTDPG